MPLRLVRLFCYSDIDFFHGIQAEAAQPSAWVHTAAVNVDEALCLVNLSLGASVAHSVIQKLRGGVSYPRVPRDALILFSIQRGMDIWQTGGALDKNGFPTLLSVE